MLRRRNLHATCVGASFKCLQRDWCRRMQGGICGPTPKRLDGKCMKPCGCARLFRWPSYRANAADSGGVKITISHLWSWYSLIKIIITICPNFSQFKVKKTISHNFSQIIFLPHPLPLPPSTHPPSPLDPTPTPQPTTTPKPTPPLSLGGRGDGGTGEGSKEGEWWRGRGNVHDFQECQFLHARNPYRHYSEHGQFSVILIWFGLFVNFWDFPEGENKKNKLCATMFRKGKKCLGGLGLWLWGRMCGWTLVGLNVGSQYFQTYFRIVFNLCFRILFNICSKPFSTSNSNYAQNIFFKIFVCTVLKVS